MERKIRKTDFHPVPTIAAATTTTYNNNVDGVNICSLVTIPNQNTEKKRQSRNEIRTKTTSYDVV